MGSCHECLPFNWNENTRRLCREGWHSEPHEYAIHPLPTESFDITLSQFTRFNFPSHVRSTSTDWSVVFLETFEESSRAISHNQVLGYFPAQSRSRALIRPQRRSSTQGTRPRLLGGSHGAYAVAGVNKVSRCKWRMTTTRWADTRVTWPGCSAASVGPCVPGSGWSGRCNQGPPGAARNGREGRRTRRPEWAPWGQGPGWGLCSLKTMGLLRAHNMAINVNVNMSCQFWHGEGHCSTEKTLRTRGLIALCALTRKAWLCDTHEYIFSPAGRGGPPTR